MDGMTPSTSDRFISSTRNGASTATLSFRTRGGNGSDTHCLSRSARTAAVDDSQRTKDEQNTPNSEKYSTENLFNFGIVNFYNNVFNVKAVGDLKKITLVFYFF